MGKREDVGKSGEGRKLPQNSPGEKRAGHPARVHGQGQAKAEQVFEKYLVIHVKVCR